MIRIIAAVALLLGASQAIAQGWDDIDRARWADERAMRDGWCFWYGGPACHNHRIYRPRRQYYYANDPSRVYSYRYRIQEPVTVYGDARRPNCLPLMKAVGDERQTQERAKDAAARAWMGAIRFHYGERYIELDNAVGVRFTCSRSSVNDTVLGKIQESAGITMNRCMIEAVACAARPEREK